MSFSNTAETAIMALLFQAVAWANMADNAASSPQTNISVAAHSADPGEAGTQSTSEIAYTSYARVNVARTTGGWAVSGGVITPVAAINFPAGTGGSGTITHGTVGKTGGGASDVHMRGTVAPNIVCGSGITPQFSTSTSFSLD